MTTTTEPSVARVFRRTGAVLVALLVTDSRGGEARAHRRVVVEAAHGLAMGASSRKRVVNRARRKGPAQRGAIKSSGHSAATATVAIKDFSFGPASITIHAGDTVTWVNEGPSNHTASSQSFDTGVLSRGHSASHVFTSPGTLNYFCSIHPFMRATVVVLANATTNPSSERPATTERSATSEHTPTSESPSSSSTTAGGLQVEAAGQGQRLPNTGMNLLVEFIAGLGLLSLGLVLLAVGGRGRARASRRTRPADRATRG